MSPKSPEFYVGWGTLALINAGLAQAKNRSGAAWFVGSLFLGPIATLIIVLLDKAEPIAPGATGAKPFNLEDYRQQ